MVLPFQALAQRERSVRVTALLCRVVPEVKKSIRPFPGVLIPAVRCGVIALTKTTAKELGSRNIRCNAVAPGFIQSKMTDVLPDEVKKAYMDTIPLRRFGTAEDIAKAVAWLAGDDAAYVTGQIISVNGGMIG